MDFIQQQRYFLIQTLTLMYPEMGEEVAARVADGTAKLEVSEENDGVAIVTLLETENSAGGV